MGLLLHNLCSYNKMPTWDMVTLAATCEQWDTLPVCIDGTFVLHVHLYIQLLLV